MSGTSPATTVRRRFAEVAGERLATRIPRGYERLGSVLLVQLPDSLRSYFGLIGRLWLETLPVETVLRRSGPVMGEWRVPQVERIAGERTETEVREQGIRYRFDAARILFSRGNKGERARIGRLVRPGERIADLFAGIGYFTLPVAVHGRVARVDACEKNPLAAEYLAENARLNRVEGRVHVFRGDNREAPLAPESYDRVLLGYLPSSLPFLPRAVGLLRPDGGWLHAHLVADAHRGSAGAQAEVVRSIGNTGGVVREVRAREIKAYGPGRSHFVVDAFLGPELRGREPVAEARPWPEGGPGQAVQRHPAGWRTISG